MAARQPQQVSIVSPDSVRSLREADPIATYSKELPCLTQRFDLCYSPIESDCRRVARYPLLFIRPRREPATTNCTSKVLPGLGPRSRRRVPGFVSRALSPGH